MLMEDIRLILIFIIATICSQLYSFTQFYFIFMGVLPEFLSVHQFIQCLRGQKRVADFLELDRVDSNYVGAGIQTRVM